MNNIEQAVHPFAPLLRGSEDQTAVKLRKRLENVLSSVSLVHDVISVCVELSHANSGDFNPEIAHVLRRCAADRLRFQIAVLTNVIQRLGGRRDASSASAATPGRAMA